MVAGHGASSRSAWATRGTWVATIHRPARSIRSPLTSMYMADARCLRWATRAAADTTTTSAPGITWSAISTEFLVLMYGVRKWGRLPHTPTTRPTHGSHRGTSDGGLVAAPPAANGSGASDAPSVLSA